MQFVPTRYHGAMDYLAAALLLCGPWLLGLKFRSPASLALLGVGAALLAASLLTNYEWGAVRRIPVPLHSALDLLLGLLLAVSPWALGFADEAWAPHATLGTLLILGALTSQPRPFGLGHPAFIAAGLSPTHGSR